MGKSISGMMTPRANMTADQSANMALQTLLFSELRQASKARHERAKMLAVCCIGVALGAFIAAANAVVPFLPH